MDSSIAPPSSSKASKKAVKGSGCNDEQHRRRRDEKVIALRKEKREEGMEKKRKGALELAELETATQQAAPATPVPEVAVASLPQYCQAARSDVVETQLAGVSSIRRLLSKESHPPVKQVLSSGILPRLIELIVSPDVKVGFEAAWAVTNIASTEYTSAVVDAGAVRPLVAGMMSGDANVRDQCVWCLGNIAGDSSKYRNMLLGTEGALQALFLNIQHPGNIQLLRNATWTLSNFCRGKPSPSPDAVRAILPALSFLLNHEDTEVLKEAAWGVSYLTDGDEATIQAVCDAGMVPRCVELMQHRDVTVVTPALRVVGNVISGNDKQTQTAVDAGALPALVPLLRSVKRTVKREACWAISNVAAGTQAQINTLVGVPNLLAYVIEALKQGEFTVRKEAAWVVSNIATTGSADHVRLMVQSGVAEPLCDLLTCEDARVQCLVLDAIRTILTVGQGLLAMGAPNFCDIFEEAGLNDRMYDVSQHCHSDVYDKIEEITDRFYGREDEEQEQQQAAVGIASLAGGAKPGEGAVLPGPAAFSTFGAPVMTNGAVTPFGFAACAPAMPAAPPAGQMAFNFGGLNFS